MRVLKPKEVVIPSDKARLKALWGLPSPMKGAVVFAHGSGSGRLSPRNNFVAQVLQDAGIATLLADLFEEPGALEKVAELARDCLLKYFLPSTGREEA